MKGYARVATIVLFRTPLATYTEKSAPERGDSDPGLCQNLLGTGELAALEVPWRLNGIVGGIQKSLHI